MVGIGIVGDSPDKVLRGASFHVDCYGRERSINTDRDLLAAL